MKSVKTALGALTGAVMTLSGVFSAAACSPVDTNGRGRFLGVPFVEVQPDLLRQKGAALRDFVVTAAQEMGASAERGVQLAEGMADGTIGGFDGHTNISVTVRQDEHFFNGKLENRHGGFVSLPSQDATRQSQNRGGWENALLPNSVLTPVDSADERAFFLCHEVTHIAGGNEQQADQIAAIRFLQDHPDKRYVIEVMRDRRQVQAFVAANDSRYTALYGQASADALTEVLAMPQSRIESFDDRGFKDFLAHGTFAEMTDRKLLEYNDPPAKVYQAVQDTIDFDQPGFLPKRESFVIADRFFYGPDNTHPAAQDMMMTVKATARKLELNPAARKHIDALVGAMYRIATGSYGVASATAVRQSSSVTNGINP